MTRTYIINMAIGLSVCGFMIGITSIVSAHEGDHHDGLLAQATSAADVEEVVVLSEDKRNRIIALANNMTRKMTATQERFYNIADRLEARANIIAQTGVNTDEVTDLLTTVRADLDAISNRITALDQSIIDIFSASEPMEAWVQAREEFGALKTALVEVHEKLRVAIETTRTAISEPQTIDTTPSTPVEPLGTIPKEEINE